MNVPSSARPSLVRRFAVMLILTGALLGGLVYFKVFKDRMVGQYTANQPEPAATVTTVQAVVQDWTVGIEAVGTVRSLRAVDLSPEAAGVVRALGFVSGQTVAAGQLLLSLNDDLEQAQLKSLVSAQDLSRLTLQRDRRLREIEAVTQAQIEVDEADLEARQAAVAAQQALIARKRLHAPFAGRIGISTTAPGQYVNPGDHLANLQDLDHLVIDFSVPQAVEAQAHLHAPVRLRVDAWPDQAFEGEISARSALVDAATRNLQVEAAVNNVRHRMLPGMFAHVTLMGQGVQQFLTLPQTAIAFNPYGAVVYVVKDSKGPDGKPRLVAEQTIVRTGPTRGDQVAVLEGVAAGARVVSSGQLKLHNGSVIVVDNHLLPKADSDPHPVDH